MGTLLISSAKNAAARGALYAVDHDAGIASGYFRRVEHCRWGSAEGPKWTQFLSKSLKGGNFDVATPLI